MAKGNTVNKADSLAAALECPGEPADMTLEELVAENERLGVIRQQVKAAQLVLQPWLDAAWEAESKRRAAGADPSLTQNIGG